MGLQVTWKHGYPGVVRSTQREEIEIESRIVESGDRIKPATTKPLNFIYCRWRSLLLYENYFSSSTPNFIMSAGTQYLTL
jgi:hypothetical protein